MKKFNIKLKATEAFKNDLNSLLAYDTDFLSDLFSKLKTEEGLVVKDSDEVFKVFNNSNVSVDKAQTIISVIQYLYDSITKQDLDLEESLNELEEFCEENSISGFKEKKEILYNLLEPTEIFKKRKKYMPWATAVMPTLLAVGGVVELRAAFDEYKSTEIAGYIPIAQIRLICYHDYKEDEDIIYHFQVTEELLDKLIKNFEVLKKQLTALKDEFKEKNIIDKL